MMNEEMQKTIQFILEQQAQFTVNQQKVEERITRLETNMAELARAQTDTSRAVADISKVVTDILRVQAHMNEVVAVMADTHAHTEQKLDAFIGVLERYISGNEERSS
jgi:3-phenylpropionate/cinnamic acid dioxygenase small subunit